MANVSLVSQKMQEIQLLNRLDKPGQIQLDSNFSLSVNYNEDGNSCLGKLRQNLVDRDEPDKFHLTVDIIGIFRCDNMFTDEQKKIIHSEVYDQLFPYVQAIVQTIAASSGIPGLMLRKEEIHLDQVAVNRPDKNPDGGPNLTLL